MILRFYFLFRKMNMDLQEINSMLLEELLGISNKRLRYIFEGKTLDEESSTDEDQPVDVISLDDISDDDFVVISDEEHDKPRGKHKRKKVKEEPKEKSKRVKKEKPDKDKSREIEKIKTKLNETGKLNPKQKETIGEENLMSVLELLELQARARAIRSQLELETKRKQAEQQKSMEENKEAQKNAPEDDDEIIIEVLQDVEIVITSSDSENENGKDKKRHDKRRLRSSPKKAQASTKDLNILSNKKTPQDSLPNNTEVDEIRVNEQKNGQENETDKSIEKEDGEVSDSENQLSKHPVDSNIDQASIDSMDSDSDSSSNDNLQVVKDREKRRKSTHIIGSEDKAIGNLDTISSEDISQEAVDLEIDKKVPDDNGTTNKKVINQTENDNKEHQLNAENQEAGSAKSTAEEHVQESSSPTPKSNTCDHEIAAEDSQTKCSKIEAAIEVFVKTQPPAPDNSEELKRLEEQKKEEKEKTIKKKEKRLKGFKNKLQSFKQDVAVESSNVNVLENIVIKPKAVDHSKNSGKHVEDSDDLVINVDQDDLDCMICD